jgi:hypothetical protein
MGRIAAATFLLMEKRSSLCTDFAGAAATGTETNLSRISHFAVRHSGSFTMKEERSSHEGSIRRSFVLFKKG